MVELLFCLIFIGVFLVTGFSMLTVFISMGILIFMMFVIGVIGVVFKLLPWLIVIAVSIWLYKKYVATS